MNDEAEKTSEMIRNGTYFDEARAWYQAIYIGPVSERTFFLIVAILSIIIALAALHSVSSLMPLVSRPALLIRNVDGRIDDVIPRLVEIKEPEKSLTVSLQRFFLIRYVKAHEGYSASTYESGANFVRSQSNDAIYNSFSASYTASNPTSYAATLGTNAERDITITSISIDSDAQGPVAKVWFTAETLGTENDTKTKWTATVRYTYSDLVSSMVKNPETGAKELNIQDPQFQVTSYELSQITQ